jgi:hypothetical protein
MLAVSDGKYELPVKHTSSNGDVYWMIRSRTHNDVVSAKRFNFTLLADADAETDRMTFTYDGNSVKPTARTLRKHGAAKLQPIVSKLSARKVKASEAKDQTVQSTTECESLESIKARLGFHF